jgi:NTP pyrophosphatase (non-canonical NTP hydrolase)
VAKAKVNRRCQTRHAIREIGELTALAIGFRDRRDWKQFHNPKDMALSLCLESAEVLELMQWKNGRELDAHLRARREDLGDELSDVLYWVLTIAHDFGIDVAQAFRDKIRKSARKYPVAKARGRASKYTEL